MSNMNPESFKNYNLLIIEDNPGDYMLIEEFLNDQQQNHRLDHAGTYEEAKNYLNRQKKNYDAILLDLKLPDKEGTDLIREMIDFAKSVPIIVLTGYSDMQFGIRSLNFGISDYIIKDELSSYGLWKSIRYSIERKSIYRQLQESEKRYRDLFESNPSPMLIWDIGTRKIVNSNREAELKFGYSAEEFKKLSIDDLQLDEIYFSGTEEEEADGDDSMLGNYKKMWRHRKKNGQSFFAEIKSHQLKDNEHAARLVIVNDITEKIEIQEKMVENAIRAEEEERNRIAKELHDSIVQQLVACGMFTQNLQDKSNVDSEMESEIDHLFGLIKEVTEETRDLSHNLKSAEFEIMTLPELVRQLSRQLSRDSEVTFKLQNHLSYDHDFDFRFKTNVYRILQELCNNVVKHSKGSEAVINLEAVDHTLFISIQDDGIGFDIKKAQQNGIGLRNVKSRVFRLGGNLEFNRLQANGMQVHIEVPAKAGD